MPNEFVENAESRRDSCAIRGDAVMADLTDDVGEVGVAFVKVASVESLVLT